METSTTVSRTVAPETLKAVVHRIYPGGPHGDYALALPKDPGPITKLTFSLENSTWKEPKPPQQGEIVRLAGLVEKRAGWQAREARFWSTDDESERIQNLSLKDQLAYYAEKSKTYSGKSKVIIEFNESHQDEFAQINLALRAMDEEEKLVKFCQIISYLNDDSANSFLGPRQNIGLTVSSDGRQIKAWFGFPDLMIKNHAEGEDYLFGISGLKEAAEKYLATILEDSNLREVKLPNGMTLYLNWQ